MSGSELIELLLTTAANVAAGWIKAEERDRVALESRARSALMALRGDRDTTAAAHDARARATDDAIVEAQQRLATRTGHP